MGSRSILLFLALVHLCGCALHAEVQVSRYPDGSRRIEHDQSDVVLVRRVGGGEDKAIVLKSRGSQKYVYYLEGMRAEEWVDEGRIRYPSLERAEQQAAEGRLKLIVGAFGSTVLATMSLAVVVAGVWGVYFLARLAAQPGQFRRTRRTPLVATALLAPISFCGTWGLSFLVFWKGVTPPDLGPLYRSIGAAIPAIAIVALVVFWFIKSRQNAGA